MKELDKLDYFDSLDKRAIILNVFMYIEDKIKASQIYNIDDPFPFIHAALEKLLEGKHAWDVRKYPDPTEILRRNTWRDICHEITKRSTNQDYKNFHHPKDIDPLLEIWDGNYSEEDSSKSGFEKDKLWLKIKQIAEKENEDAWCYLEALEEIVPKSNHTPKRAEIAEYLGWDLAKVSNVKRWIKRHTTHYLDQQNTGVIA